MAEVADLVLKAMCFSSLGCRCSERSRSKIDRKVHEIIVPRKETTNFNFKIGHVEVKVEVLYQHFRNRRCHIDIGYLWVGIRITEVAAATCDMTRLIIWRA